MILRRFMKHVSDQNWFAVGLDVVVVITGIFLGMQVTDWNDDRKNDLRAEEILVELKSDFRVIDENARELILYYRNIIRNMEILVRSVRSGEVREEDHPAIGNALSYGGTFGDPPPPSGVFRELVSSGNLSLIRSKDLRFRLMEYDHSIGIITSSDMSMHTTLAAFTEVFGSYSSLDLDIESIPDGDLAFIDVQSPGISDFDFDGMTSDPRFLVAAEAHLVILHSRLANASVAASKIKQINELLGSGSAENP